MASATRAAKDFHCWWVLRQQLNEERFRLDERERELKRRGRRVRKSSLDISREALGELSSQTLKLISEYFDRLAEMPVFPVIAGGEIDVRLGSTIPLEAEPLVKLIEDCRSIIDGSRHNGQPRFFGYVASPSTPPGAFAELIAATLNSNVTCWRSAPAATEIERLVVRWLGSLIGYSDQAHGLLTSGGSMANLIALLVAHRAKLPTDIGRKGLRSSGPALSLYASNQIHLSVPKAADILGVGRDQVRLVNCDNRLHMDVQALRELIEADLNNGLKPFCIVASAGTVNTGAVDPLREIAAIAKEFGVWFHVDGAYGALGVLDKSKRHLFAGIELADSVSLDPHKWLYVPVDAGCLLFHDAAVVRAAFSTGDADYIKVFTGEVEQEAFAFWDYGVELSRPFRALKIWLTLRYYGARRIAEAISDDNSLAEYLAALVEEAEDFELLAPVELSICCFRYVPWRLKELLESDSEGKRDETNALLDQLNTKIMNAVQRGGQAYVSNATINGRFALRACITNYRTTKGDIEETLEIIRNTAQNLDENRPQLNNSDK